MNLQPIIDQIESMSTNELIQLNNAYCQENNIDSEIYANDEYFFETYLPNAYDALQKSFHGSYNFNDNFVRFDGYTNLESLSSFNASELPDNIEVIAEYVYDNQREFYQFDFDFSECDEDEDEDEDEI